LVDFSQIWWEAYLKNGDLDLLNQGDGLLGGHFRGPKGAHFDKYLKIFFS